MWELEHGGSKFLIRKCNNFSNARMRKKSEDLEMKLLDIDLLVFRYNSMKPSDDCVGLDDGNILCKMTFGFDDDNTLS